MNTPIKWHLGYSDSEIEAPLKLYNAHIPGAVQLDMAEALGLPDFNIESNVSQYQWMENKFWHYTTIVNIPEDDGTRPVFVLEGVEYEFSVYIDNKRVLSHEGMFTPVEIDLSNWRGQTDLPVKVVVFPAPKINDVEKKGGHQAGESFKPVFSYGGDWSPRLISLGIYMPAYIDYRPLFRVAQWDVTYSLSDELDTAFVHVAYELDSPLDKYSAEIAVTGPDGQLVTKCRNERQGSGGEIDFEIKAPLLWWPAGHGEQPLYTIFLTLSFENKSYSISKRTGFRRTRLVMYEGAWVPIPFPSTRATPPITLEINGRRIFAKGSNFVPPFIFPSQNNEASYRELILSALHANMNILRLWGGGYIQQESFYDLCDEYGIMLWQEFVLSGNNYPDDKRYLGVLEQEASAILRRLRSHPSVVMWCGGNELFCHWSRMTDQSLPLRVLSKLCLELDPYTPFIPSSPLYGMSHGHYYPVDLQTGLEALELFYTSKNTAYTEFGCASLSPWNYLQTFLTQDDLSTFTPDGNWRLHHASHAWKDEDSWFSSAQTEYFWGKQKSLRDYVEKGNILQALVYRHLFEEARMQWPVCSMALNWCFNEPWPTAAGNSLLNFPAAPKPAYSSVQLALKPQRVALRIPRLVWIENSFFDGKLWLLNDGPADMEAGTVTVFLLTEDQVLLTKWGHIGTPAMTNSGGPSLNFTVPPRGQFIIRIQSEDHPEWNTEYTLFSREQR